MKLKNKKERKLNQSTKQQKYQKSNNKLQQGITLIALVITIIVLLILAGVSIATLTGDNGILTKTQVAKEETQNASEEEQRQLAILNASMNTENYDYPVEDGKVTIPAGFAPTEIEGENTVKNGFVITDSKGNEFIWIPVTSKEDYVRNIIYKDTNISTNAEDDKNYLPDRIENEIDAVVKDDKPGGFYISRFEAGKEGSNILVSKKGATVWNNIPQEDCKTESKKFINNSDVKSALISGIQWDMVMNFIGSNKDDGEGNPFNVEKENKSRHTGSLEVSGKNLADKVCNIYDLEGNCMEFVAEKNSYNPNRQYVRRGGRYTSDAIFPASYCLDSDGDAAVGNSFRFVLYVMQD